MNGGNLMLLTIGIVGVLMIAIAIITRGQAPGGFQATELGAMSEQWLAEHRASHSA